MVYKHTGNNIFQMAYGFAKQAKFILSHFSILELLSIYYCLFFRASVSVIKKAMEVITPQKGSTATNEPLHWYSIPPASGLGDLKGNLCFV